MATFQEIREQSSRRLYKELSNKYQRDEAAARTEALWSNMKIEAVIDWEHPEINAIVMKTKAEIEGTLLDLIVRRDA